MSFAKPLPDQPRSLLVALLPAMSAVLAGFLVIGAALPVLPLHVHQDLGFGSFVVGLVAGSQFAASVVSRVWAGSHADTRGGKRAVTVGLVTASISGVLYLLSLGLEGSPSLSVAVLLLGRAVLGGAESFVITGGIGWGLALTDSGHAGKVIAWVGMAMFASLALGGPVGVVLFSSYGFTAVSLLTILVPMLVLLFLVRVRNPPKPLARTESAFGKVVGAVWLPGLGLAFSSIGYAAVLAFGSLLYDQQGWKPVWLPFTAFGVSLIFARVFFGHLPDKFGGAKMALIFVVLQSGGVALMWLAPDAVVASAGAALAGFGYSLVYPGLGVEAVRSVTPDKRGLAMGVYTVFLDVAMAAGTPMLGLVADGAGLGSVFLVSAVVTMLAAFVTAGLLRPARSSD